MASDSEASCISDPNFAVICSFLEKFGASCGITSPDFLELQEMLENTQEISPELIDLHIKLLRKVRRSVSADRWERVLTKVCHSHCSQDAWELERFGYKKARLSSKLRILKKLMEMQFDLNQKFKSEINRLTANELRTEPIGRDKHGHSYWYQIDDQCQLRVYREDIDEETWTLIANDREGLVRLITQLTSDDPNLADLPLNEDSNSEEIEKPILDTGQTSSSSNCEGDVDESSGGNENSKDVPSESQTETSPSETLVTETSATDNVTFVDENPLPLKITISPLKTTHKDESVDVNTVSMKNEEMESEENPVGMDLSIPQSTMPTQSKGVDLSNKRKKSINDLAANLRMKSHDLLYENPVQEQEIDLSLKKPRITVKQFSSLSVPPFEPMSLESALRMTTNFPESEEEVDDEEDEYYDEDEIELPSHMKQPRLDRPTLLGNTKKKTYSDEEDEDYSEEIEEPMMLIQGEGSGKDCENENILVHRNEDYSEAVEEPVMFFYGEGSGYDCNTGNTGKEDDSTNSDKISNDLKDSSSSTVTKSDSLELVHTNEENSELKTFKNTESASNISNEVKDKIECDSRDIKSDFVVSESENLLEKHEHLPKCHKIGTVMIDSKSSDRGQIFETISVKKTSRWDIGKPTDDTSKCVKTDDDSTNSSIKSKTEMDTISDINIKDVKTCVNKTSEFNREESNTENENCSVSKIENTQKAFTDNKTDELCDSKNIKTDEVKKPPIFFFGPGCFQFKTPMTSRDVKDLGVKDSKLELKSNELQDTIEENLITEIIPTSECDPICKKADICLDTTDQKAFLTSSNLLNEISQENNTIKENISVVNKCEENISNENLELEIEIKETHEVKSDLDLEITSSPTDEMPSKENLEKSTENLELTTPNENNKQETVEESKENVIEKLKEHINDVDEKESHGSNNQIDDISQSVKENEEITVTILEENIDETSEEKENVEQTINDKTENTNISDSVTESSTKCDDNETKVNTGYKDNSELPSESRNSFSIEEQYDEIDSNLEEKKIDTLESTIKFQSDQNEDNIGNNKFDEDQEKLNIEDKIEIDTEVTTTFVENSTSGSFENSEKDKLQVTETETNVDKIVLSKNNVEITTHLPDHEKEITNDLKTITENTDAISKVEQNIEDNIEKSTELSESTKENITENELNDDKSETLSETLETLTTLIESKSDDSDDQLTKSSIENVDSSSSERSENDKLSISEIIRKSNVEETVTTPEEIIPELSNINSTLKEEIENDKMEANITESAKEENLESTAGNICEVSDNNTITISNLDNDKNRDTNSQISPHTESTVTSEINSSSDEKYITTTTVEENLNISEDVIKVNKEINNDSSEKSDDLDVVTSTVSPVADSSTADSENKENIVEQSDYTRKMSTYITESKKLNLDTDVSTSNIISEKDNEENLVQSTVTDTQLSQSNVEESKVESEILINEVRTKTEEDMEVDIVDDVSEVEESEPELVVDETKSVIYEEVTTRESDVENKVINSTETHMQERKPESIDETTINVNKEISEIEIEKSVEFILDEKKIEDKTKIELTSAIEEESIILSDAECNDELIEERTILTEVKSHSEPEMKEDNILLPESNLKNVLTEENILPISSNDLIKETSATSQKTIIKEAENQKDISLQDMDKQGEKLNEHNEKLIVYNPSVQDIPEDAKSFLVNETATEISKKENVKNELKEKLDTTKPDIKDKIDESLSESIIDTSTEFERKIIVEVISSTLNENKKTELITVLENSDKVTTNESIETKNDSLPVIKSDVLINDICSTKSLETCNENNDVEITEVIDKTSVDILKYISNSNENIEKETTTTTKNIIEIISEKETEQNIIEENNEKLKETFSRIDEIVKNDSSETEANNQQNKNVLLNKNENVKSDNNEISESTTEEIESQNEKILLRTDNSNITKSIENPVTNLKSKDDATVTVDNVTSITYLKDNNIINEPVNKSIELSKLKEENINLENFKITENIFNKTEINHIIENCKEIEEHVDKLEKDTVEHDKNVDKSLKMCNELRESTVEKIAQKISEKIENTLEKNIPHILETSLTKDNVKNDEHKKTKSDEMLMLESQVIESVNNKKDDAESVTNIKNDSKIEEQEKLVLDSKIVFIDKKKEDKNCEIQDNFKTDLVSDKISNTKVDFQHNENNTNDFVNVKNDISSDTKLIQSEKSDVEEIIDSSDDDMMDSCAFDEENYNGDSDEDEIEAIDEKDILSDKDEEKICNLNHTEIKVQGTDNKIILKDIKDLIGDKSKFLDEKYDSPKSTDICKQEIVTFNKDNITEKLKSNVSDITKKIECMDELSKIEEDSTEHLDDHKPKLICVDITKLQSKSPKPENKVIVDLKQQLDISSPRSLESVGIDNEESNDIIDIPETDPLACTEEEILMSKKLEEESTQNKTQGLSLATFKLDGTDDTDTSALIPEPIARALRSRKVTVEPVKPNPRKRNNDNAASSVSGKKIKGRSARSSNQDIHSKNSKEVSSSEEEVTEIISEVKPMIPQRGTGKAKRGRIKGKGTRGIIPSNEKTDNDSPVSSTKPQDEIPTEENTDKIKTSLITSITPSSKKKRRVLGLDIDPSAIIDLDDTEKSEEPVTRSSVRQSRRIAQLKIKEEAERRKLEELTLQELKDEQKKKKSKRDEDKDYKLDNKKKKKSITDDEESEDEVADIRSKKKHKKKKHQDIRKLFNMSNPWQSSSESSSSNEEEEEEEVEEEPTDEEVIKSDHEFSPESDLENNVEVQPLRRARTVKKESDTEEPADEHACQKCGKADHPEWILLCDKCDCGWHCSCLRPALLVIPEGDWFCPPCQHIALIEALKVQLIEYDKRMNRREMEVRRKQRLAYVGISLANVLPSKDSEGGKDEENMEQDQEVGSYESSDSESESGSSSGDESEPIYQLRERRQAHSYRFNDYDELINSAIQDELEAVKGAGNQGRGKDIATIVNAEKEEAKNQALLEQQQLSQQPKVEHPPPVVPAYVEKPEPEGSEQSSDEEPRVVPKLLGRKKHRKLNSLDVSSEDDPDDDEDFKGTSASEEEDFEEMGSEDSEELDLGRRGRGRSGPIRRSTRARTTRYDKDFINDDEESEDETPKRKKIKSIWDESESEESDKSWGRRKRSKKQRQFPTARSSLKKPRKKRRRNSNDTDPEVKSRIKKPKIKYGGLDDSDDELLTRRTRGKKINYLDALASDSDEDKKKKVKPIESEDEYVANEEEDEDAEEAIEAMEDEKESDSDSAENKLSPVISRKIIKIIAPSKVTKGRGKAGMCRPQHLKPTFPPEVSDTEPNEETFEDLEEEEDEEPPVPVDIPVIAANPDDLNEEEVGTMMMENEEYAKKQLELMAIQLAKEKKKKEKEARKLAEKKEQPPTAVIITPPPGPKKRGRKKKSEIQAQLAAAAAAAGQMPPSVLPLAVTVNPTLIQPPLVQDSFVPSNLSQSEDKIIPPIHNLNISSEDISVPTVVSELTASPPKRRGRGKGKKTLAAEAAAAAAVVSSVIPGDKILNTTPQQLGITPITTVVPSASVPTITTTPIASPGLTITPSTLPTLVQNDPQNLSPNTGIHGGKLGIAAPPQPFSQNQPTPSVITRMLQSQPISAQTFTTSANAMNQKYFPTGMPPDQQPRSSPSGQFSPITVRSRVPSPYRQSPPAMGLYSGVRALAPNSPHRLRSPGPPNMQMFHSTHHPMDPSPSGGGPINIVQNSRDRNSPGNVSSPMTSKEGPTPPPPPYSRTLTVNRYSPNESSPGPSLPPPIRHHMFSQAAAHLQQPSPPPRQPPPGNFSPYHPPPPPNYHYGAYPPAPSLAAADDALPPTDYQGSPYPEHYNTAEGTVHSSEGSNSKPFDEEGSGEFGGLVSYFSSQREDDLDT